MPSGACDCHAHVIGLPPEFPFVVPRAYTPPEADDEAYLQMLDTVGMDRGVLVQVSVHGTDNRRMLRTLKAHPQRLRGVAVVAADTPVSDLEALADAGVRGVRLNALFAGGVGLDQMERLAERIRPLGWHLQIWLDIRSLPQLAPRLLRLDLPVVIDHLGHFPTDCGLDHPGFRCLCALMGEMELWVKLSGAYRISTAGPPYADTVAFARALVETAPDRLVWGSDWPHVAVPGTMPNVGDLLDLFALWVLDPAVRRDILVANAERLYGFAPYGR